MALEDRFGLPRRQVPNAQRVVPVAGNHVTTIGCDCYGSDQLSRAVSKIRMRGYLTRMNAQFRKVVDTLLP